MKNKKKSIIWLVVFIILIITFTAIGTYAIFTMKEYKDGTFNIEVKSKGIDIFTFDKGKDAAFVANVYNFARGTGRNLTASTYINPRIKTSNNHAKVCYELSLKLPDNQVFTYSEGNTNKIPELLLNVEKSSNGKNYEKIIDNMDITTSHGTIKIPNGINENDFKNVIEATKDTTTTQYWNASITLVFLPDIDQVVNDEKTFNVSFDANVVKC